MGHGSSFWVFVLGLRFRSSVWLLVLAWAPACPTLSFVTERRQLFPSLWVDNRKGSPSFPQGVLMRLGRTKFAALFLAFSLACTVPQILAKKKDKASSSTDDQRRA